ncbi:MAG: hypothetical protein R2750_05580 [Bacteroidales bacterium]
MNELNKLIRKKFRQKPSEIIDEEVFYSSEFEEETIPTTRLLDTSHLEKEITRILLLYGNRQFTINDDESESSIDIYVASFIINDLKADDIKITTKTYCKIFDLYDLFISRNEIPKENYFIAHEDKKISTTATDLLLSPYYLSPNWELKQKILTTLEEDDLHKTVSHLVLRLKDKILYIKFDEIENTLKQDIDDKLRTKLQEEYMEFKKISMKINNILGSVITR